MKQACELSLQDPKLLAEQEQLEVHLRIGLALNDDEIEEEGQQRCKQRAEHSQRHVAGSVSNIGTYIQAPKVLVLEGSDGLFARYRL